MKDTRSTIATENLQELLDAAGSAKQATLVGQAQYQTDPEFAEFNTKLLPSWYCDTVFDPQCADGNLFAGFGYNTGQFGFEIDNRYRYPDKGDRVLRVVGNCVDAWRLMDELFPDLRFQCQVANPPFSIPFKVGDKTVESTKYTWKRIVEKASVNGFGYFIAAANTIEKLGIHEHEWVYLYQRFPVGVFAANVEIGVVHWHNALPCESASPRPNRCMIQYESADGYKTGEGDHILDGIRKHYRTYYPDFCQKPELTAAFTTIHKIMEEERKERPDFNIYLKRDKLQTYLSTKEVHVRKLDRVEILKLERIRDCHPLALTTDRETRKLLKELVECGFYTIQPQALKAIDDALKECETVSCPIMPVNDFEAVAYTDEEDTLACHTSWPADDPVFTKGVSYPISTASFQFNERFNRKKVHFNEETMETYTIEHQCELSGSDRFIRINDDQGRVHRFMDRPTQLATDHDERTLWTIFKQPKVDTVAERHQAKMADHLRHLKASEMYAGFTYYPGQVGYACRMGVKDYGLVAAETGCGKTLLALTLMQLKNPKRALIVAPQATMKKQDDEDDSEEALQTPAQWIAEIRRFCPGMPVFELFSMDDYRRIRKSNDGSLPFGVYVTYPEAMFSNGARENAPESWNDKRLEKEMQHIVGTKYHLPDAPAGDDQDTHWCETVGRESEGIRCIVTPCMATLIGHYFDFVGVDEAHLFKGLSSQRTEMLIRLQPKYRFAFTATPISNLITDLFPLFGWLCVPEWFKGGRRNASWPYAREELSRFMSTFLTTERDITMERIKRERDKNWKGKCEKISPVIAQPAVLLKLLKPTMGFISKVDCNHNYIPPEVIDVRVPLGKQQLKLYAHFMNRGNIPAKNALIRARKQIAYLRYITADPAGFEHGGPTVWSNFNPKTLTAIQLVQGILGRGEQVVVICSRIGQNNTIANLLRQMNVRFSRIDSTIPADRHSAEAHLFKTGKTRVMLMGIKCAAAHSFDACENEIILSLEYSPGPLTQAKGRIDRVTNKVKKRIYCILHKDTIEETMFDQVALKDDAALLCLHGRRLPRDFKPVDMAEILALNMAQFNRETTTAIDEKECEAAFRVDKK